MTRPTGQDWRNWKKKMSRAGHKPADWGALWDEMHRTGTFQRVIAQELPSPDLTPEELVSDRIKRFKRKAAYEDARKLVSVTVPVSGPFGIVHLGDPHVDDDGCDWESLLHHIHVIRHTTGLFAANVGDTRNNWVGRLARLYGSQSTSAKESLILADYFLNQLEGKWAYIIGGNHDLWSGEGNDPLEFIAAQLKALYEPSEARVRIANRDGKSFVCNARHDFAGSSQWNPVHAVSKAIQMGHRDDVSICGHKHQSGYGVIKSPEDGRVCHAIQVASFKVYDRYSREKGFRDQAISPSVTTVFDPEASPEGLIKVFWNVDEAAEYLYQIRNRGTESARLASAELALKNHAPEAYAAHLEWCKREGIGGAA